MAKREPGVLIVTGDEEFLCRRTVQDIVSTKGAEGWKIERADGAVAGQLDAVLDGSGFVLLSSAPRVLVVVENPDKIDPQTYKDHLADPGLTTLLLHYDGIPAATSRFGKFVAEQKAIHKECKAPKRWEAEAFASDFVVKEAKRQGLSLEPALAGAVVERAGSDLGVLSFEVLKFKMLAQATGVTDVTPDLVGQSLAQLTEAEVQPVVEAVSQRNVRRLCQVLDRLYRTSKSDSTVMVCRVLGSAVMQWISIVDLRTKGKSPDESAALLGVHPWVYKNKLLPQASGWNLRELTGLLQALACSERAVFSGAVHPWQGLVGRLVSLCQTR
jgi:DNA polymerase III delta subunit